jgi:hypothetical protein
MMGTMKEGDGTGRRLLFLVRLGDGDAGSRPCGPDKAQIRQRERMMPIANLNR